MTGLIKHDNMEFSCFVNIDDAVQVCGRWENNDIIDQMKASCEAEEKDEEINELLANVTNKHFCSGHFEEIC